MKKFLVAVMFGFMAIAAQAEATFDQVQGLIQQGQYAAAEQGLEVIIKNHPQSAKAFYAMAQAQAGLGNLDKAQKALNIATGLNPALDFAPASSVASLRQAITPQTTKIESIEETHTVRNTILLIFVFALGFIVYSVYRRNKEADEKYEAQEAARLNAEAEARIAKRKQEHMEMLAKQDAERKAELAAEEVLKSHKNYNHERFDPANPDKLKSVKQFKAEQAEAVRVMELREAQARAEAAEASARMYRTSAQAVQPTHTTVVNNSGNDMLTGVLIGNMMSSHHDTTRVVEREVVREVPAPSRSSTWDDTPAPSKSSSWDDTPSKSSRSSSWDDDSSSKSSSSWSSSSSDSGSSWSSSSDSSSSSSSWD
jgi:tetratricopeptide (TPR) repeat protein